MKKIWLIDDDNDDKEIFEIALGTLDVKTSFFYAADGEQALEQIRGAAFVPDYIFLDLNMPRLNGVTFLTTLRDQKIYPGIPVFIYTTSSVGPDIDKSINLGGQLLTKHSDFAALCRDLKRLIV